LVSKQYFNQDYSECGIGGSIPFMEFLQKLFPKTQFIATGVTGMDSNIHGPNENLNLSYTKTFICGLSHFISEYNNYL